MAWSGSPDNFKCQFCDNKFQVGMEFRMLFTNDMPKAGGNPLICRPCFTAHRGYEGARAAWAKYCEFKRRGAPAFFEEIAK